MKTNEFNWLLTASAYESPRLRSVDLRSGNICLLTSIKGGDGEYGAHQDFEEDEEGVNW